MPREAATYLRAMHRLIVRMALRHPASAALRNACNSNSAHAPYRSPYTIAPCHSRYRRLRTPASRRSSDPMTLRS